MISATLKKAPRVTAAVVVALIALAAAACGSAASSPTPSPTPTPGSGGGTAPSATAQITSNWQRFFAGSTPASQKIGLLEGGQHFAGPIKALAGTPIGKSVSAKVSSVKVVSSSKAIVTYTLSLGGKPVLKNAKGQAVLQNGVWKVGAGSFQGLLGLQQSGGPSSASPSP